MKSIKSILLRLLGQQNYLKITSGVFFLSFRNGWLKNNPGYYTHYLIQDFIKPGFTVIDIGANLGYYSKIFAEKTGPNGRVYSVEPIELYRNILKKNMEPFPQVKIFPIALGEIEGSLKMGNPSEDKHRHGLMRVLGNDEDLTISDVYEVEVKTPMQVFGHLESLDYIKCDIEGYEVPVIPAMKQLIEKLRPVIQVETEGPNKVVLMKMFSELGYSTWYAGKNILISYTDSGQLLPADLIAIPTEKENQFHLYM